MTLGTNQAGTLRALREHGYWYGDGFGCGWNWNGSRATRAILDSLVKRGLVTMAEEEVGGRMRTVYRPATAQPVSAKIMVLEQRARELMKALGDFSGEYDSARVGFALGLIAKAVDELTQARIVTTAQDQRESLS